MRGVPTVVEEALVQLRGGGEMSAEEADAFLRMRRAQVIALVGGNDVGKTTLLASLYELAHRNLLRDYWFAGSETLRGFEQRCFLSRSESGRLEPDTERTSRQSKLKLLHIRFIVDSAAVDLVLSDRAGESYVTDMLDAPQTSLEMPELSRSDCMSLLVDGKELATPDRRQLQIARVRRLWMSLLQTGVVRERLAVQVVLTKLDILQGSPEKDAGLSAFEELVQELRARASGKMLDLSVHHIASRPAPGATLEFGTGLESLLRSWMPVRETTAYRDPGVSVTARDSYERLMAPFDVR